MSDGQNRQRISFAYYSECRNANGGAWKLF
jgi:hypothetical protein